MKIDPKKLRTDGGTQARERLDPDTIADYKAVYESKGRMHRLDVCYDGENYWVFDGFHRLEAAIAAGVRKIDVEVHMGDARTAILYSLGANAYHGLRRTNADKRRAIMTMLNDPEWSQWSDARIAERCRVSDRMVASYRPDIPESFGDSPTRKVERNGTVYDQKIPSGVRTEDAEAVRVVRVVQQPEPEPTVQVVRVIRESDNHHDAADDMLAPRVMSDQEWLDQFPVRSKLSEFCRNIFDADATAYCDSHAAAEFGYIGRLAVGNASNKVGEDAVRGIFVGRAFSMFDSTGPGDWILCGGCCGSGCQACHRRGYIDPPEA